MSWAYTAKVDGNKPGCGYVRIPRKVATQSAGKLPPNPEAEYMARYCQQIGRGEIPEWQFYLMFSLFRLAAIVQGVYKRTLDGIASSPEAINRKEQCQQLSTAAWALVERGMR